MWLRCHNQSPGTSNKSVHGTSFGTMIRINNFSHPFNPMTTRDNLLTNLHRPSWKLLMKVTKILRKHTQKASRMGRNHYHNSPLSSHSFFRTLLWSILSQVTGPWPQTFGIFSHPISSSNFRKIAASLKPPHAFVVVARIITLHSSRMPCHCHCYLWQFPSRSSPPYREEILASTNLVECCGGEHLISYNEGHSDVQ